MTDWKVAERSLARLLGGERVPVNGRRRGDVPDIAHPTLAIEVKQRKKLPAWLHNAVDQAQAADKHGDKLPIVILHEDRMKYTDSWVMLSLSDFLALLEDS